MTNSSYAEFKHTSQNPIIWFLSRYYSDKLLFSLTKLKFSPNKSVITDVSVPQTPPQSTWIWHRGFTASRETLEWFWSVRLSSSHTAFSMQFCVFLVSPSLYQASSLCFLQSVEVAQEPEDSLQFLQIFIKPTLMQTHRQGKILFTVKNFWSVFYLSTMWLCALWGSW